MKRLLDNSNGLQRFCDINITTLNEHASCKNKCAKLTESHYDTKLLNSKTEKNRALYVKQRNQRFHS